MELIVVGLALASPSLGAAAVCSETHAYVVDTRSQKVRYVGFAAATSGTPFETSIAVDGVDTASFRELESPDRPCASGYAKDKSSVFFRGDVISGADGASFKVLEGGYAVDKASVYFEGRKLGGFDAATFRVLPKQQPSHGFHLTMDKNGIHYRDEKVPGVDMGSVRLVGFGGNDELKEACGIKPCLVDRANLHVRVRSAYSHVMVWRSFARATIKKVGGAWTRVGDAIFFEFDPLVELEPDANSLCVIGSRGHAVDKDHVYHCRRMVDGAKPQGLNEPPAAQAFKDLSRAAPSPSAHECRRPMRPTTIAAAKLDKVPIQQE